MFHHVLKAAVAVVAAAVLLSVSVCSAAAKSDGISAKAYLVMDASTGRILVRKNAEMQLPVASTTKILTAWIALSQPDIHACFPVDKNAIRVEGTSMGLRAGDSVDLYTLAAGMLLSSGNDAANAAAVKIAGSLPRFAEQMNQKAASIGMKNSHFVSPSGLPDEMHYSTAADMALLTRYALQNKDFASICKNQKMTVSFGNPPMKRTLSNHNRLLKLYPGCIGVKTGFTKKAGRCLVSAAERDGARLICVTLNDPNDWDDHCRLLEESFQKLSKTPIAVSTDKIRLSAVGGTKDSFSVQALAPASFWTQKGTNAAVRNVVCADAFYYAPIHQGDYVGEIRHYVNGIEVSHTDLVAREEVPAAKEKKGFFDRLLALCR